MKPNPIFYILLSIFLVAACKNDAAVKSEESGSANEHPSTEGAQGASQMAAEGHDYNFLTDKLFHYKSAFAGNQEGGDPPFKDEWIDLEPDGTYKAGKLKKQTHTGKWSYNHGAKIIQLLPDDSNYKRREWKVLYNNQLLVWVGTATYGDNAIQVQLVRSDNLP